MSDSEGIENHTSDSSYEPSDCEVSSTDFYNTDEDLTDEEPLHEEQAECCLGTEGEGNIESGNHGGEPVSLEILPDIDITPELGNHHKRRKQDSRLRRAGTNAVRRQRSTVFCFFCEQPVLQFARHLTRHHPLELEVQRIDALKKNQKQRKRLISVLRNKGNYLRAKATNNLTPVRKPCVNVGRNEPLPCSFCYGLYARKQLWRHVRQCPANVGNKEPPTNYLNVAQNLMLSNVHGNDYLKEIVFPRMRADDVALTIKADPLICAFGSRFAKTHRASHQVNLISRRMRELGRLMIEVKRGRPQIKSLIDVKYQEHNI